MKNCLECQQETPNPKFCSRSCSATFNNRAVPKRTAVPPTLCEWCKTPCARMSKSCRTCFNNHVLRGRSSNMISSWLSGEWCGGTKMELSLTVRRYLMERAEHECSLCGYSGFHPRDGKTILEIDHINGDGTDHRPENLRVLCPNCHALTPSYRGRNRGNGTRGFRKNPV